MARLCGERSWCRTLCENLGSRGGLCIDIIYTKGWQKAREGMV